MSLVGEFVKTKNTQLKYYNKQPKSFKKLSFKSSKTKIIINSAQKYSYGASFSRIIWNLVGKAINFQKCDATQNNFKRPLLDLIIELNVSNAYSVAQ